MRTICACLSAALLLCGCGKPTTDAKRYRVALVMKSLANEFFKTMEDGARAHQAQNAGEYELLATGTRDEQDVLGQNALIEQMIAQRVDAIIIAPADSKALIPVCKRAQDAGIVVVNIDNKFDAAALADKKMRLPFVGPDNREGARLAGAHLAGRLKAGDEVAIIEGLPGAFNGDQRRLGFEDAVRAAGLKIVASQTARWEMNEASKVVGAMLPAQPNLKALLCANDNMALGAAAALRNANRPGVLVAGFDNISAARELLKEGRLLCTVDQHGDQIAVFGIRHALDILKGGVEPADKPTPVDLVTADQVK